MRHNLLCDNISWPICYCTYSTLFKNKQKHAFLFYYLSSIFNIPDAYSLSLSLHAPSAEMGMRTIHLQTENIQQVRHEHSTAWFSMDFILQLHSFTRYLAAIRKQVVSSSSFLFFFFFINENWKRHCHLGLSCRSHRPGIRYSLQAVNVTYYGYILSSIKSFQRVVRVHSCPS